MVDTRSWVFLCVTDRTYTSNHTIPGKHVVSSLCNGLKISSAETQHAIGGYRRIKLSTHCQGIQGELILRTVVNAAQVINNHRRQCVYNSSEGWSQSIPELYTLRLCPGFKLRQVFGLTFGGALLSSIFLCSHQSRHASVQQLKQI